MQRLWSLILNFVFKIGNSKWPIQYDGQNLQLENDLGIRLGICGSLILNFKLKFNNSKWPIQYGGQKLEETSWCSVKCKSDVHTSMYV